MVDPAGESTSETLAPDGSDEPDSPNASDEFDGSTSVLVSEIGALQEALSGWVERDDPSGLLSETGRAALAVVEQALKGRESLASEDLAMLLAQVRLARFQALPAGEDRAELPSCLKWFARVRRTNPERVPASVREALDESAYGEGWEEFGEPEWLSGDLLDATIVRLEKLYAEARQDEALEVEGSGSGDGSGEGEVTASVAHAVTLVAYLSTRYEQRGDRQDLDRAITLGRWVLGPGRSSGQPRLAAMANLGGALMNAAESTSDFDALDEAVDMFQSLVDERGTAADYANLAVVRLSRFEVHACDEDLDASLVAARVGVRLTEPGDPFVAARLSNLGSALRTTFERDGDETLLDEAIRVGREAVRLSDPNDLDVVRRLTNLSSSLSTRFQRRRQREDIDESIRLGRLAVSAGPVTGHPGRVGNLASALHMRGTVYGRLNDLQEALRLARAAAQALPVEHADRVDLLINAAGTAMSWFDWTGDRAAVLTSVELGRIAALEAPANVRGASVHSNLSVHLLTAFEAIDDLDFAELAYREADAGVRLAGDRVGSVALSNLSLAARTLFEETGVQDYLAVALDAAGRALESCPVDHPDRSAFLSNLGLCLYRDGRVAEAVEVTIKAHEHPASAGTASGVAYAANAARMLSEQPGGADDPRVLPLWEEVAASTSAPVPLRIEGLVTVARASAADVAQSADLYRRAVELLPAAAWHGIDPISRTRRLAAWQGLARDAGAMTLQADGPAAALALLDGSLSQLWSRDTPSAREFELLRRADPELAGRLEAVRRARTVPVSEASGLLKVAAP